MLEHPFYERWSAGELSGAELGVYAGEYRRAVIALAETSALAAASAPAEHRPGLERHAEEGRSHVALWDGFARAAGAAAMGGERPATEQTRACAAAWTAGTDALEHLAVLYAVEAGQPEIARTKLDGLIAHYGYAPEGPAVEYFTLHERLDVEHARQAAELIERLLDDSADREAACARMLARAQAALRSNWELLSGVEALASRGQAPPVGAPSAVLG